jgi:hypothetical protein
MSFYWVLLFLQLLLLCIYSAILQLQMAVKMFSIFRKFFYIKAHFQRENWVFELFSIFLEQVIIHINIEYISY